MTQAVWDEDSFIITCGHPLKLPGNITVAVTTQSGVWTLIWHQEQSKQAAGLAAYKRRHTEANSLRLFAMALSSDIQRGRRTISKAVEVLAHLSNVPPYHK